MFLCCWCVVVDGFFMFVGICCCWCCLAYKKLSIDMAMRYCCVAVGFVGGVDGVILCV